MTGTRRIATETLAEEIRTLVREGRSVTLTARGDSMNPFFRDRRDKVTLAPVRPEELRRGEVVFARTTDGRYVLHRIVGFSGEELRLLGDGNLAAEERALPEEVIGRMVSFVRKRKTHTIHSCGWRCYSFLWAKTRRLRPWLLPLWRKTTKTPYHEN